MKLKVIMHPDEEGGFWAEIPALPGCVSQGDTWDETLVNVREAGACHLDTPIPDLLPDRAQVEELEV